MPSQRNASSDASPVAPEQAVNTRHLRRLARISNANAEVLDAIGRVYETPRAPGQSVDAYREVLRATEVRQHATPRERLLALPQWLRGSLQNTLDRSPSDV